MLCYQTIFADYRHSQFIAPDYYLFDYFRCLKTSRVLNVIQFEYSLQTEMTVSNNHSLFHLLVTIPVGYNLTICISPSWLFIASMKVIISASKETRKDDQSSVLNCNRINGNKAEYL